MGGKSSAPAAPDYTPVAQADDKAAQLDYDTSQDQLNWAKEQYADQAPLTSAFVNQEIANSAQQTQQATQANDEYQSTFVPMQNTFAAEASGYDSHDRSNQQAGAAEADVASQFAGARSASQQQLESYGIDPSQTRYAALDLGSRVSQAAATAAAGTQSRLNTYGTGLALQGSAIDIGNKLPGNVATSYAGANSSGSSGVTSALNTSSTYGNLEGTATQYAGLGNSAYGSEVGALNTGFQDQLGSANLQNQENNQVGQGIGSLVGGALAVGALNRL